MRALDFTYYPVALVVCKDGQIKWFKASENFSHGLKVGEPLDSRSLAYACLKHKVTSEESDEQVPVDAWIRNKRVHPDEVVKEECLPLPNYSTVLVLLHYEKSEG